jgi:hypothetical protein
MNGNHQSPTAYGLRKLRLRIPSILIGALGYRGLSKYFSISQPPGEDHVLIYDGYIKQLADQETWQMFLAHPANWMILSPYNLEGKYAVIPGDLPVHHILIDTKQLTAYIGISDQAEQFLSISKPEGWINRLDTKAQTRLEELIKQTMREIPPGKVEEFQQRYEVRAKQLREKLQLSMDLMLRLN